MHVIINHQRVSFENRGNQVYCTSYDIARVFNKDHYNVLRDIQKLEKLEEEAHEEGVTPRHLNFEASAEVRKNGLFDKETKYYNLTRDGFALLAMGFTGAKAYRWKLAFLEAFNEMERRLRALSTSSALATQSSALTVYEKIRSLPLESYKDVRIAKEFGEFLVSTFGKRAALPLLCDFLGLPHQPSPSEELREQEREDSELEEWVKNNLTYIEGARGFLSEFHAAYLKHGGKQGANQLAKAIIKITGVRPQSKRINGIVRKIYYDLGLNEAITVIPA